MSLILVGDLGATNIRLQLIQSLENLDTVIKSQVSQATEYCRSDTISHIKSFLEGHPTPDIAVLGISGIVKNNKLIASFAYSAVLDDASISQHTGIPQAYILNDLEASGYGVCSLSQSERSDINQGTEEQQGPIVCISVGTRIGQTYLVHNGLNYQAFPTEAGGHDYSPKTIEDQRLSAYLAEKNQKIGLSYDDVVSGTCSREIYDFMKVEHPEMVNEEFIEVFYNSGEDQAKIMMDAGFSGRDKLAEKAVEAWQRNLGNLISNIFLNFIPTGGIYLCGGVVAKNHEGIVRDNIVTNSFYSSRSRTYHESMRKIPIFVVNTDDLGVRGCVLYAKQKLVLIRN